MTTPHTPTESGLKPPWSIDSDASDAIDSAKWSFASELLDKALEHARSVGRKYNGAPLIALEDVQAALAATTAPAAPVEAAAKEIAEGIFHNFQAPVKHEVTLALRRHFSPPAPEGQLPCGHSAKLLHHSTCLLCDFIELADRRYKEAQDHQKESNGLRASLKKAKAPEGELLSVVIGGSGITLPKVGPAHAWLSFAKEPQNIPWVWDGVLMESYHGFGKTEANHLYVKVPIEWANPDCRQPVSPAAPAAINEPCGKSGCVKPAKHRVNGSMTYYACDDHLSEIEQLCESEDRVTPAAPADVKLAKCGHRAYRNHDDLCIQDDCEHAAYRTFVAPAQEDGQGDSAECQRLTSYGTWKEAYASAAQGAETWKMETERLREQLAAAEKRIETARQFVSENHSPLIARDDHSQNCKWCRLEKILTVDGTRK